jgi:hypothetical protein
VGNIRSLITKNKRKWKYKNKRESHKNIIKQKKENPKNVNMGRPNGDVSAAEAQVEPL